MIHITPDDNCHIKLRMMKMKMIMMMVLMMMILSILIPGPEMEVLPFYASIAQASSGLSVAINIIQSTQN